MSAAEKLRALDEAATPAPWHTNADAAPGVQYVWNDDSRLDAHVRYEEADALLIAAVRSALPQIVALVEAAEFARNWPEMPSDLRWEDFDVALAALDEKLGESAA